MSDFKNYLFEKFIKNHKRLKKLISLTGYCKQDDMYWGSSDNYEQYVSYEVWKHQQAKIDELEEMMLRDGALATKAQMERNEWQEVVKSQQKTIENLTNQKEVVNITVDDSNHFEISEKVEKAIKRGARLTRHQIDLRGAND